MHNHSAMLCIASYGALGQNMPMNKRSLAVILGFTSSLACGGVAFDTPDPARVPEGKHVEETKTDGALVPGFYDVVPEPSATPFGLARLSVLGSSSFELSIDAPQFARARFYVAFKVAGRPPSVASPVALVADGKVMFSVEAKWEDATVLVYLQREGVGAPDPTRDELIGTSWTPTEQNLGYLTLNSWRLHATNQAERFDGQSPIYLRHTSDLQFALCDEQLVGDTLCGKPIFPSVRIYGMSITAYRDQGRCSALRAGLELYMLQPALRERSTIEVNGEPYEPQSTAWKVDNVVRVVVPGLPAWTARVILPSAFPVPTLANSELRVGKPFTLTWDGPAWATKYTIDLLPNGIPVGRFEYPHYETLAPRLQQVFTGFPVGASDVREVGPSAKLSLTTWREQDLNGAGAKSYQLSVLETTTVVTKQEDAP